MPRTGRLAALVLLAGCAAVRPEVQVRAFAGAAPDGTFAWCTVREAPDVALDARCTEFHADGAPATDRPLEPAQVQQVLDAVRKAGTTPRPTAVPLPAVFDGLSADAGTVLAGPGPVWPLTIAGVAAELSVEEEPSLHNRRVLLRLKGEAPQATVALLPHVRGEWTDGIRVLPGGRRALLSHGAAVERGALWRTETLTDLDLGGAAAALLDARAVDRLSRGDTGAAQKDLEQAVAIAPDDAAAHYNLACAFAKAGEEDRALLALGRAVQLDPGRLRTHARFDPDLASLRDRPEFILMIEPRPGD